MKCERESMARVMVIIVNFNGGRWMGECLTSLSQTEYPNFKVLVVDNGSTDGSADKIREAFPSVELIMAGTNLGFCLANNLGIWRALEDGYDFIALLNPDTRVETSWLRAQIEVHEADSNCGITGAVQLRYEDDQLNSWTRSAFPALQNELEHPESARRSIPVEWVEGSCLIMKRRLIEEVGALDPIFFSFYEEIDLCRRARYQGYKVALVPQSRVHHHRGGTWEATEEWRRRRDRQCDRSQFIHVLTDPRRGMLANFAAGLRTFVTKLRLAILMRSGQRLFDLAWISLDVSRSLRTILRKWDTDRARLRSPVRPNNFI